MSKKLNNVLSFKDYESLNKLDNKPGKVLEGKIYKFDNFTNEEWEFGKKLASKLGLTDSTPEEIKEKADNILKNETKLIEGIKKSSNPNLHMKNYEMLKKKGGLPYYSFVIFLNKNYNDLISGTPLYYKIDDFGVTDTSIRTHELGADYGAPKTGY